MYHQGRISGRAQRPDSVGSSRSPREAFSSRSTAWANLRSSSAAKCGSMCCPSATHHVRAHSASADTKSSSRQPLGFDPGTSRVPAWRSLSSSAVRERACKRPQFPAPAPPSAYPPRRRVMTHRRRASLRIRAGCTSEPRQWSATKRCLVAPLEKKEVRGLRVSRGRNVFRKGLDFEPRSGAGKEHST